MPLNPVAIVTGATRGLGWSLSKKLLEAGYMVFGISRTENSWKQALADCPARDRFFLQTCDLSQESEVKQFVDSVLREASKIDLLVNNAGYGGGLLKTEEHSTEELNRHFQHNLFSAFYMAKYLMPIFKKQQSGRIIHISSMAGKRAVPNLFGYSASKFGILALSQCLAKENEDWDFKSVTICPGGINTKMRSDLFGEEDASRQQSADFVSGVIMDVLTEKTPVASGGDIVIRHGEITAVNAAPAA